MKNWSPILILAFATLGAGTAFAIRQTVWMPMNYAPAMGHAVSPSTQDVTKNTATYTITASVTDLDTFYNNLNPSQTSLQAGNEGDVSINTNLDFSNVLSSNPSFDPATGKREVTYVIKNNSTLADQGDVQYVTFKFQGVDHITESLRHDPDTAISQSLVALKYVSPPAHPPKS